VLKFKHGDTSLKHIKLQNIVKYAYKGIKGREDLTVSQVLMPK